MTPAEALRDRPTREQLRARLGGDGEWIAEVAGAGQETGVQNTLCLESWGL